MKKIILSLAAFGSLAFAGTAYAQMGMMGNYWYGAGRNAELAQTAELKSALQEIYASQAVSDRNQIDCAKVGDNQFEKLGDAYMGAVIGNDQTHEAMDNMMGGEGSQSLALAHINMGRSYLGCWSNYNSGPVYMPIVQIGQSLGGGSVGFGMMNGYGPGYGYPMMQGWGGYGFGNTILMSVWLALGIIGLVSIIRWAAGLSRKQKINQ